MLHISPLADMASFSTRGLDETGAVPCKLVSMRCSEVSFRGRLPPVFFSDYRFFTMKFLIFLL